MEKKYPQSVVTDGTAGLWKTLLGKRNQLMKCFKEAINERVELLIVFTARFNFTNRVDDR